MPTTRVLPNELIDEAALSPALEVTDSEFVVGHLRKPFRTLCSLTRRVSKIASTVECLLTALKECNTWFCEGLLIYFTFFYHEMLKRNTSEPLRRICQDPEKCNKDELTAILRTGSQRKRNESKCIQVAVRYHALIDLICLADYL